MPVTNRFHEYIRLVATKLGYTMPRLAEVISENQDDGTLPIARQWSWEISNRPTIKIGKRVELIEVVARVLREPMSKLAFLAGMNPWADRMTLEQQGAMWIFMERVVQAKEKGEGKPPVSAYNDLMTTIFGGLAVQQKVTPQEMAEYLKGDNTHD